VDGVPMNAAQAGLLLKIGAAVHCPNNTCSGVTSSGVFTQYHAFVQGGGYYTVAGPGALYFSSEAARAAAINYSQSHAEGTSDVRREWKWATYEDDSLGVFSYDSIPSASECPAPDCSSGFNPVPIPPGVTWVDHGHAHPWPDSSPAQFGIDQQNQIWWEHPERPDWVSTPAGQVFMIQMPPPELGITGTLCQVSGTGTPMTGVNSCH
jgi:hypothetical protein